MKNEKVGSEADTGVGNPYDHDRLIRFSAVAHPYSHQRLRLHRDVCYRIRYVFRQVLYVFRCLSVLFPELRSWCRDRLFGLPSLVQDNTSSVASNNCTYGLAMVSYTSLPLPESNGAGDPHRRFTRQSDLYARCGVSTYSVPGFCLGTAR